MVQNTRIYFGRNAGRTKGGKESQNTVEVASLFEEEERSLEQRIDEVEAKTLDEKVNEFTQRLKVVNSSNEGRKTVLECS